MFIYTTGCKFSFKSQPIEEAECNPYSVRRLWTACVAHISPHNDQQFKISWYVNLDRQTNAETKRIEQTSRKYFIKEYRPEYLTGTQKLRLLSTLTIFNLVDFDSGQYWCQIELMNASCSVWQSERSTVFTLRPEQEYQQMGKNSCTSKEIFFVATKHTCVNPQEKNLFQNKSYGNKTDTDNTDNQLLSLLLLDDHANNDLTHLALKMSISALALSSISFCILAICLVGMVISTTAQRRRKKKQRTQINPESSRGFSNRLSDTSIRSLHMSALLTSPIVTTTGTSIEKQSPTVNDHLVLTSHDLEDVTSDSDSILTLANMAYDQSVQTHTQRNRFTHSDRESSTDGDIEYDYVDVHNIRRVNC